MKTVCLLSVSTQLGGGERSLIELAAELRDRPALGWEPWLIFPKSDGPMIDIAVQKRIAFDCVDLPSEFLKFSRKSSVTALARCAAQSPEAVEYLARLRDLIRSRGAGLLHSNGTKFHFISAPLGRSLGLPVVWHLRDRVASPWLASALRLFARIGKASVIANSRATAETFASDCAVVHNGLNPALYHASPDRARVRESWSVPNEVPLIGIVGALARWKGQLQFLRMAARLREQGVQARFVVVGGEIYDTGSESGFEKELHEEARRLGLSDSVIFSGFRSDSVAAISALDLLVHASIEPEPFGRVILEGWACGVPVVASRAGGVLEIVTEGKDALLHEPGNVSDLAAVCGRVIGDRALREGLALAGHQTFLERFTIDRHAREIARIYDRALKMAE